MRNGPMRTVLVAAAVVGVAVGAAPLQGQESGDLEDGRWLPYLGCWVDVAAVEGPMTCVVPEGAGVAVLTVADSEVTDRRVVAADGAERPTAVSGCTGAEAARFSSDGHRVYTTTSLTCGDAERQTRGLMAMVATDEWIEVRALGAREGSVAWVKRYRPADSERIDAAGLTDRPGMAGSSRAMEAARAAASASITVDELIEAHARTDAEAVRAWIAEKGDQLRLDADRLVRLADAGVPSEVIDVAVAVSFPDRFAVERAQPRAARQPGAYGYGRYGIGGLGSPFFGPMYYDPFYARYDRFYRYSGYGYYGSGYNIGSRPTVIVVSPERPVTESSRGRVVRGKGYTRSGSSSEPASRSVIRTTGASGSQAATGARTSSNSGSTSKGKAKAKAKTGGGG